MKIKTLKKNYEFKRVLNKGKYINGKYIEAFIFKTKQKENRIGIAISVKTCKAVKRNRIKRLIRENYRLMQEEFNKSFWIVFLWKKKEDIKEATFFNIQKDIKHIKKEIDKL